MLHRCSLGRVQALGTNSISCMQTPVITSGPASPTLPRTPGGPIGPSGPGFPSLPEGPTGPGGPCQKKGLYFRFYEENFLQWLSNQRTVFLTEQSQWFLIHCPLTNQWSSCSLMFTVWSHLDSPSSIHGKRPASVKNFTGLIIHFYGKKAVSSNLMYYKVN